jgi:hypothetical protein
MSAGPSRLDKPLPPLPPHQQGLELDEHGDGDEGDHVDRLGDNIRSDRM